MTREREKERERALRTWSHVRGKCTGDDAGKSLLYSISFSLLFPFLAEFILLCPLLLLPHSLPGLLNEKPRQQETRKTNRHEVRLNTKRNLDYCIDLEEPCEKRIEMPYFPCLPFFFFLLLFLVSSCDSFISSPDFPLFAFRSTLSFLCAFDRDIDLIFSILSPSMSIDSCVLFIPLFLSCC